MKLTIIETPYDGNPDDERYLLACLRDSLLRGEAPLVLRSVTHELEEGPEAERAWRRAATQTVFYMDLGFSDGMNTVLEGIHKDHRRESEVHFRRIGDDWDE